MNDSLSTAAPSPLTVPQRRWIEWLQIAGFLLVLTVPLLRLGESGGDSFIEKTERRPAAMFPNTTDGLRFPTAFEAWFNDHLGLRSTFIRLYNAARIAKLTGPTLADFSLADADAASQLRVLFGRDGWLFYGSRWMIDDFRRTHPFTPRQLTEWRSVLQARHEWLARRGIRYVLLIAPNQQTIYPEKMPRSIERADAPSRFDQLKAELAKVDGFALLDPRERLTTGKSRWPTYHKTDTHWNDYGSFLAYAQLCEQLQKWFPTLRPATIDDFQVTVAEAPGRHLADAVDSFFPYHEELVTLTPRRARQARWEKLPASAEIENHALATNPAGEIPGVVVLHDSFFSSVQPFFDEHGRRVRYVWTDDFPVEIIEAERPRVVVQELVERKLMFIEPHNPPSVAAEPHAAVAQPSLDAKRR